MKQLTQKLKDGKMQVLEVPVPVLSKGMVLVKNHYSLISAGTEGSTVTAARKSLVGKAKDRPQQVKQAFEVFQQQGIVQTYRAVMKKLDSYSPLGYSSAGEVIAVAPDIKGLAPGDFVACGGGGYASHAEVVAVPLNLCVKLNLMQNADCRMKNDGYKMQKAEGDLQRAMKKAAYNTVGAIALQGIRQADLRLGETCVVIGLGLIGQLTCLMLRAGGLRVFGIDISASSVDTARKHCVEAAFTRDEPGLAERIDELTYGIGADAVIITAATDSIDPVNFAGSVLRKKGKVVIVGDVPTCFDREPYYYKKELELRMSCSYGPGRYDLDYEEKGQDYPAAYVRWTENRNMQAFQELVQSGKIDLDYLTTHTFRLDDAPSAYDMIMERKEPFLGILLEYDVEMPLKRGKVLISHSPLPSAAPHPSPVVIAFVGAGSYAMSYLLPNIPKDKDIVLKGVMTSSGTSSRTVAEKYGFEFCTSEESDIFGNRETALRQAQDDKGINTVFIATRHNTHVEYVLKSLQAGKNVFVEKPLCLNEEELSQIVEAVNKEIGDMEHSSIPGSLTRYFPQLMVGFNRRFSPLARLLKEKIGSGPMSMIYRINAGHIPPGTWIQDEELGGGRIIGEVCHFVDLLSFLCGSLPESVYASALPTAAETEDTVNISLAFKNGSIGTISYFSNGSKSLFKEYVEVYGSGSTGILKDFRELEIYGKGKPFRKKLMSQDKGQKEMVRAFIDSIRKGLSSPIFFEDIYAVTLATFKAIESLRTGQSINIR